MCVRACLKWEDCESHMCRTQHVKLNVEHMTVNAVMNEFSSTPLSSRMTVTILEQSSSTIGKSIACDEKSLSKTPINKVADGVRGIAEKFGFGKKKEEGAAKSG